jgi:alpha-D-ribose 1-methylphosphonate 5-triphosphate diphosphatase PhnM
VNPARLLALPQATALAPGAPADVVELSLLPDGAPRVARVWVRGALVFEAAAAE